MNRPFDRRTALIALGALGLSPLISYAQTDAWPSRPVKLIVPAPPGGPTDAIARLLAERMQAIWKQTVLVDYKPGGGTMIATQFVAKSPADGYTLGMAVSAHMINPSLQPAIPYNTTRDLTGVSHVALAHFGLFAIHRCRSTMLPTSSPMPGRIRASSAMPRRGSEPARTWRAKCSITWPESTWCMCPTRAALRQCKT